MRRLGRILMHVPDVPEAAIFVGTALLIVLEFVVLGFTATTIALAIVTWMTVSVIFMERLVGPMDVNPDQ